MQKSLSLPLIIGGSVVTVAIVAGAISLVGQQPSSSQQSNQNTGTISVPADVADGFNSTEFRQLRDGTYRAEGSYTSPAGAETIIVDLTLVDGVVTEVTVRPTVTTGTSGSFQALFANGVRAQVVGKKIEEAAVGRVNGSSLTGNGFNRALQDIVNQAAV